MILRLIKPGLHMEDPKNIAETLTRSIMETKAQGKDTLFLQIIFIHECEARWAGALSSLEQPMIPVKTETVSPPVVLSPSVVHPEAELHPRPDNQMEVDAASAHIHQVHAPQGHPGRAQVLHFFLVGHM